MKKLVRVAIMAVVLWFVWKDRIDSFVRPSDRPAVPVAVPDAAAKAWIAGVDVNGILPADRAYYGLFFEALDWTLGNDGDHDTPLLDTNEKLRRYMIGSLDMAIEKKAVGKYPGLGEALDKAFALAASGVDPATLTTPEAIQKAVDEGLAPRPMTKALRERFRQCAKALRWKLLVRGE